MSNCFNEHGLKVSRVMQLMPSNVYVRETCLTDSDLDDFLHLYGDDPPCSSTLDSELHCWYLKWTDDKKLSDECNTIVNPLRTVVAYMHQGNKYFTVHKQIIITSPAFTL